MALLDILSAPIKSAKTLARNPSFENFGKTITSPLKQANDALGGVSKVTPWKFDDTISKGIANNITDNKGVNQAAGVAGLLALGAAPAMGGAAAAPAGSYGAGAYGTAAGYGGVTAPAVTGSIGPGGAASGGPLKTAGGYAKTGLQAMQAAQLAQSLFGPQQKQVPQIAQPSGAGAQELAALNQSRMQGAQNTAAAAGDRQRRNQEIIQQMMMGRTYG